MEAELWLAAGADHRGAEKLRALCDRLQVALPSLEIVLQSKDPRPDDNYNTVATRVAEAVLAAEAAWPDAVPNMTSRSAGGKAPAAAPKEPNTAPKESAVAPKESGVAPSVVSQKRRVFGLLLCGSGHGVCMQANRQVGIRAINAPDAASAQEGRAHSDANILCLAADRLSVEEMLEIVQAFLETNFLPEPRYIERIRLLDLPPLLETEVLPELSSFQIHANSQEAK